MTQVATHSNEPAELIDLAEARVRAERLACALDALAGGQERLLELAEKREAAVRHAQPLALAQTLRDETEEIREIAALDAARAEQADWFAARLELPKGKRPRATWIASRLPVSMTKEKQRLEGALRAHFGNGSSGWRGGRRLIACLLRGLLGTCRA